ncbi:MAG: nucleotidyltransferase domain-containing protein [Candidatus Altiarchaeota archaeon]|nr:nucleotidyltransferase domain-containing protein [Candidatus Altiarchaeota archaeon]
MEKIIKKEKLIKDAKKKDIRMESIEELYGFSARIVKKFGSFIKAIVVFGSFSRRTEKNESDTDIAVIVDDSFAPLDKALYMAFQSEIQAIQEKHQSFHINIVTISQFWDSARRGDPLVIQMLRDGVAISDLGFFAPLKRLLLQGKIRPTHEAAAAAMSRAFYNLNGYTSAFLGAASALYWSAVEAAHAGLMAHGQVPGSPWDVPELLRQGFVQQGKLEDSDVKVYEAVFELMKQIERGDVKKVEPAELERLYKQVSAFVAKIDQLIKSHSFNNQE